MPHCMEAIFQHDSEKVAVVLEQKEITYKALLHEVKKLAGYFQQQQYSTIGIHMENSIEWIQLFLGAITAGVTPVLFDTKWSAHEYEKIRQFLPVDIIFTAAPEIDTAWPFECREAASLFIGFTSGTTGMPKGYERTHASWLESFRVTSDAFRLEQVEHYYAPGPLVHSMTLFAMMQALVEGKTIHLHQKFQESSAVALLKKYPQMALFVVPTMVEKLAATGERYEAAAIISSGAKWSDESRQRIKRAFPNVPQYEFYGASEASYISYSDGTNTLSVGKPFSNVQISIRNEDFQEVAEGELYIKSPMVFSGYVKNEAATKEIFRDGWLKVGDIATMDEAGYLYLIGREKNKIITGGLNVFPEEVENVLARHSAVEEVIVMGMEDTYWGEKVVACVKWKNEPCSEDEMRAYCSLYLPAYKIPKAYVSVATFAYTASGKIARNVMKQQLAKEPIR